MKNKPILDEKIGEIKSEIVDGIEFKYPNNEKYFGEMKN